MRNGVSDLTKQFPFSLRKESNSSTTIDAKFSSSRSWG